MIKFVYTLKVGTGEDFYLLSKNECILEEFEDEEAQYKYYKQLSQEELKEHIENFLEETGAIVDTITSFFSEDLLNNDRFVSKVTILDITDIKLHLCRQKTVKESHMETSMRASEVLKVLNISRQTLYNYVKDKKIEVDAVVNGRYRYNRQSVMRLLGQ